MSDATPAATPQGAPQGEAPKAGEAPKDGQQPGQAPPPQDGAKPADAAPAKVVPEKYDLKPPEQSHLDAKDLERIAADAKARGLSQEEAQKLLERDNGILASYAERQKEQFAQTRTTWVEAIKTDKELGGDKLSKNMELAKRALDRFGSQSFKDALNETGLGDHPELVRVFYRIGKLMANDSTVLGGDHAGAKKSTAEILYGNSNKEK